MTDNTLKKRRSETDILLTNGLMTGIERAFNHTNGTLEWLGKRVDVISERLDGFNTTLLGVMNRLNRVEAQLSAITAVGKRGIRNDKV